MHLNKYQKHQNMNSFFKIFFVIIVSTLYIGCTPRIVPKETLKNINAQALQTIIVSIIKN
tara:strand:+ start:497 stop:676 length:180 start_codon:yes stop_codon:yes gene_type:complete